MKATAQTRRATHLIQVTYHGQGVTYHCRQCGYEIETNAYYEADHKEMIRHADHCVDKIKEETSMAKKLALQQYGERDALSEMMYRVKHCVPNGMKLQDVELKSLAQVAIATGLNPFTGEIWYIPGKGPMAGIKGLRRRAREQSTYTTAFRAMRDEEITKHNLKPGDVGRICELFRHDILQKAVEINRIAGGMVVPVKPILGIGIWQKDAGKGKPDQVPATKSSTWMANKRAEADALRQGFDLSGLPYSDGINGSQLEIADMEDAGWSVAPEEAEAVRREAALNGERRAQASETEATHFDPSVIARYKQGELELPPWVSEIREAVEAHPQASDPVHNGSFIKQLEVSAGRKVSVEQFRAFVQITLGHPLDGVTFGEASILMGVINADDFEAKVVSLLS